MGKLPAPPHLVAKVETLFNRAISGASAATISPVLEEKLFELYVLGKMLAAYKLEYPSAKITLEGASTAGTICIPKGPASANKTKFSYFKILNGSEHLEGWISVQVRTLSWDLSGSPPTDPPAGKHELDVAIFKGPVIDAYPAFDKLLAAASCKHVKQAGKKDLREALGLRREMGFLTGPRKSRVPWLVPRVPARPASALFLISSDPGCRKYRKPVNRIGLYVRYLRFPI